VISGAFNNKSVHFVGVIIVRNNSILKVFYIKSLNSVLFNSIGIFYRVGSIAKLLNIKPVQEKTIILADTQN
jgi:hypothetical protein